eukprot:COSAG02_NODE_2059_length_9974_cov_6.226532_7_plen_151_part_00
MVMHVHARARRPPACMARAMVHSAQDLGTGEVGVSGQSPLSRFSNFSADSSMGALIVPIGDSAEKLLNRPFSGVAVILRSIQQDFGELDPLQCGILAARRGVLCCTDIYASRATAIAAYSKDATSSTDLIVLRVPDLPKLGLPRRLRCIR